MAMQHREVAGSEELPDEIVAKNSHLIEQHNWDTYFSFGKTVADEYLTTVLVALSRNDVESFWQCGRFYWRTGANSGPGIPQQTNEGVESLLEYLNTNKLL